MKRYAIIVAAGSGSRMNADVPKQFMLLAGKPILMHTIQRFFDSDPSVEIIVVVAKNETGSWKKTCDQFSFSIPHHIVEGGETRFHSVKNGLNAVNEKSIVAIHDGARPFVNKAFINRCFMEAEKNGNAVPAIAISESMRIIKGDISEPANRDAIVLVQTPQCFDSEILKAAYKSDHQAEFTDDATVVEFYGETIHLINGERENIKITYPLDLISGESILKKYFQEK